jgi:hypothetical protein
MSTSAILALCSHHCVEVLDANLAGNSPLRQLAADDGLVSAPLATLTNLSAGGFFSQRHRRVCKWFVQGQAVNDGRSLGFFFFSFLFFLRAYPSAHERGEQKFRLQPADPALRLSLRLCVCVCVCVFECVCVLFPSGLPLVLEGIAPLTARRTPSTVTDKQEMVAWI